MKKKFNAHIKALNTLIYETQRGFTEEIIEKMVKNFKI